MKHAKGTTSASDWLAVRRAFEAVVELDEVERATAIARELPGRPDLAARVRELLASARTGASPLDGGALQLLEQDRDAPDAADLRGQIVAGYTIAERISSGGMGDVWRGERAFGPSRRRVAVKVLKRGLDTDALLRRFRTEAETLASLHHARIVSFLDAGALRDGRPYFVMEHVDGRPIDRSCRERELPTRARLALFLEVCGAVSFAHANLVLHRDLKPSNILVTEDGTPKLCDFGVAKILGASSAPGATDPERSPAPWTPRYASPEQVRGERATVATDVYGLGLVLYELLADRPAFERRTVVELLERAPGWDEPMPPSELADETGARRRALRGDLDAIVLRALHPEPAKRYASIDALAADVRRHLRGEPIRARRAGAPERAWKLLRRHRWSALAAGVLLFGLAAGLVGTWAGKRRAEREASRGWGAHSQARVASRFLEELLAEGPAGASALAGTRIDSRVADELGAYPEAEAIVRIALGRLRLEAGRAREACPPLERAVELARDVRSVGRADAARALSLLGRARAAAGDERAEATLREAIEALEALPRPDPEALAATRTALDELRRGRQ